MEENARLHKRVIGNVIELEVYRAARPIALHAYAGACAMGCMRTGLYPYRDASLQGRMRIRLQAL